MDAATAALVRELIAASEARIKQHVANLIQQTTITNPTPTGNEDGADGWPDAGKPYQRAPHRMQHFGFRSVPPKNTNALMLLVGGGSTAEVTVAEDGDGYGPTLAVGEAAIYSTATGASIKINKDGKITIDATAGQDIVINGGTLKVARDTDPLSVGAWTHVPAAGAGVTPCSLSYTPPGGAPTPIVTGTSVTGKITNGATRIKG